MHEVIKSCPKHFNTIIAADMARSTINQSRLNWCMLLHIHNKETDALNLRLVANEFVSRNIFRQLIFGKIVLKILLLLGTLLIFRIFGFSRKWILKFYNHKIV